MNQKKETVVEYNPFFPAVQQNPFPYYAYLRQHAPVYQVPGVGSWAVSRYDDVLSILKNPHAFSSAGFMSAIAGDLDPYPAEAPAILGVDPPDHTRLRKLVNRAFTPRRVASLEARIRDLTHRLLDQIPAQDAFDLMPTLAMPLPVLVIAELLGVPAERYADFKRWADSIVRATNGTAVPPEEREQLRRNLTELFAYFDDTIAAYRREPKDNLLSDLIRAEEENQILSAQEVRSTAVFLILAGSETTANLIGNAVFALCEHPQQLVLVRENRALIANVVEETLRYDGSIQLLPRVTKQDIAIAGTTIPAWSMVLPLLGSANHDEQKFPDPERFDIMRNTDGHIGFGFGIHFCLGAQLARLETKHVIEALLERFPHIACRERQLARLDSMIVRGLKTLPLVVG